MNHPVSQDEAASALDSVAHARRQVAQEVGLPRWYWWSMAAWWVVVGAVAELDLPWLAAAVTLLFGAAHAAIAGRLLPGRRRTGEVQVSAAVAGRRTALLMVGLLVVLGAVTVGVGFALDADGMEHASLGAGVLMGAVVGFGGPALLRTLRKVFGA